MNSTDRRLQTTVLFSLCLLSLLLSFEMARAPVSVPVPARKPPMTVAQGQFGNFMDFSQALPFFTKASRGFSRATYPHVPAGDVGLYREIFTLQAEGKLKEAESLSARLQDKRLMGHVLYQRYIHPSYKTSFPELKAWLDHYAAEPGADRIYKLALSRMPKGFDGRLNKPEGGIRIISGPDSLVLPGKAYQSPRNRGKAEALRVRNEKAAIINLVRGGNLDTALKRLQAAGSGTFDSVEYDLLRAQVAAGYMYKGKISRAYEEAVASAHRSGTSAPLAGWVAGMTAWKNGRYAEAAKFFAMTARSEYSSGWLSSAGAFWTARAHMRLGHVRQVSYWLDKAAQHPRTFYGLIAIRSLGRDFAFNWHVPTFTKKYYDILMETPEGSRAIALVAAGQPHLAESELLRLDVRDGDTRTAVLAYAGYADLPGVAMRLGNVMSGAGDGKIYDAALYPRAPWHPDAGYAVDPSLINAIARQESRFDPAAKSSSGALGIMQLMPATANAMSRDMKIAASEKEYRLKDPYLNVEIGQRYIQTLLKDRGVRNDILKLLVAYNAGPGNLSRWEKQLDSVDDPLMFIELIPSAQTRTYVERVLSNYWIYRLREGRSTPTLDALAAGRPALYAADFDQPGAFRLASR